MKYDLWKFGTPFQQLVFSHFWPFSNKHFSNYENCSILMWLEMVLQAKNIYVQGKNMTPGGSFSIRFKAKL